MAEEPLEEKTEGAPEWMVSYADMITIMMSFFVVMFALATKKDEKAQQAAAASLEHRFSAAWRPFAHLFPRGAEQNPNGEKKGRGKLFAIPSSGDVTDAKTVDSTPLRIRIPGRGDRLDVGGIVYFEQDSGQLSKQQTDNLRTIAEEIAGKPQKVEILGHTTKRPMPPGSPYKDHWDLAYAHCRAAMQQLVAMGIDPKRIRIGVAGSNEPLYLGDSPELVKQNSRVDIYLIDSLTDEVNGEK